MIPKRETETIEFKKTLSEIKEGVISVASMLNKSGEANLYFGIKNDGLIVGVPIGSTSTTKIANEIKNFIKPTVFPKIEVINEDGTNLIKVSVFANDAPYSAYGRYFIRVDDQDQQMPQSDLENAFSNRDITYGDWENTLTDLDENYVDEERLIEFVNRANEVNRLSYRYRDVEDAMTKLGLMVDGKLNNAGHFLFGNDKPMMIKLAIFTSEERTEFVDSKFFEGNIFECIEESLKYVTSNIHFNARIVGFERQETPEIPLEAIREIVINSYAHMRVTPGEYNEITISPRKIRVYNPGTIALGKDPNEFAAGKVGSKLRNPLIALTLYKNKSIEAFGTGFRRVFDLCKQAHIAYEYGNDGFGFYFTFLRPEVESQDIPQRNDTKNERDTLKDTINDTISDTINGESETINASEGIPPIQIKLKPFQEDLYLFIRERGVLRNTKVATDYFRVSRITVQRALNALIEEKLVRRVGSRKTGYWEPTTPSHP